MQRHATNAFQDAKDREPRNKGNLKDLKRSVGKLPERANPADLWDLAPLGYHLGGQSQ